MKPREWVGRLTLIMCKLDHRQIPKSLLESDFTRKSFWNALSLQIMWYPNQNTQSIRLIRLNVQNVEAKILRRSCRSPPLSPGWGNYSESRRSKSLRRDAWRAVMSSRFFGSSSQIPLKSRVNTMWRNGGVSWNCPKWSDRYSHLCFDWNAVWFMNIPHSKSFFGWNRSRKCGSTPVGGQVDALFRITP